MKYLLKQRVDIKRRTGTRLSNTAAKGLYNTNFLAMKAVKLVAAVTVVTVMTVAKVDKNKHVCKT